MVAVAGAAEGSIAALVVGLAASIPVIVYVGAALIGSVAGGMLVADPWFDAWFESQRAGTEVTARLTGALLVVAIGAYASPARRERSD